VNESLFILVPISVLLVFAIALIFWWSVRQGQFDDLEGPGFRVIMDDDRSQKTKAQQASEVSASQTTSTNATTFTHSNTPIKHKK
jgi:cbb3-type cytochrome oxidase maturation protein